MLIDESRRKNLSRMIRIGLSARTEAEKREVPGIENFTELLKYVDHKELWMDAGFNKSTLTKKLTRPDLMKIAECIKLAPVLHVTPEEVVSLALNELKLGLPKQPKPGKNARSKKNDAPDTATEAND
ncbi:hypothetical protein [Chitinophaga qingshengii]|uniref:Uncharacterized protein n=1 Tax=Chitinophaga qingshengii TaxID=1569794 RepID=A0ABR7TNK4_9BACT|nr:hypothetical protein [Chitinophaga qingshengii]MBC9932059.1 hypothetical protein [Chitinophaga qingshengii]